MPGECEFAQATWREPGPWQDFARDVHIGPAGSVAVGGEVEVLLQAGGMAVGAHVVPGLVRAVPVQPVAGAQRLVRIQMKPALAALILRPAVPRDPKRLKAAARHRDQILLQRENAEGIGDRKITHRTASGIRADHEFVPVAEQRRHDAEVIDLGAGEIAEHRRLVRRLHRQRVMRAVPALGFGPMTSGANLAADILRRDLREYGCRRPQHQAREHQQRHRRPLRALTDQGERGHGGTGHRKAASGR